MNQSIRLLSGPAHPKLTADLGREMGVPVAACQAGTFADGETRVSIQTDMQDMTAIIVQPTCPPVNDNLMALVCLADAAHAAGAARVIAVVPYFGYARQERRRQIGDTRSAQIVCRLLGDAGIDHLITLELHVPALESALPMPVTQLSIDDVFVPKIRCWGGDDLVVVSPDAGGLKRAQRFASTLGSPLAVIAKERRLADTAAAVQVIGDVKERTCLIVDDMATTGRTLAVAAEALRRAGARDVQAAFAHSVLAAGAIERLEVAKFSRVLTSDSVPGPAKSWLEVVSIASMLSNAIGSCVKRIGN